jgi:BirA family biotin operon repressor/biotin-[acetyl-CoA-carboxylase] ligase
MIIINHKSLNSTIETAELLIHANKYHEHFAVVADTQTSGRGRSGNDWSSPMGGLYTNIVLNHISKHHAITLYAGYCILLALAELTQSDSFRIKWPNDIYLFDKKVCGILCNKYDKFNKTSIGIGLNTNISDFYSSLPNADTIVNLLDIHIDNSIYLEKIVYYIISGLLEFEEMGIDLFLSYYQKHDFLSEKYITIENHQKSLSGLYVGVANDGGIQIKLENDTIQTIYSGTVNINQLSD